MRTPICDFIDQYRGSDPVRMHMPGHKGVNYPDDITEIRGADVLYHSHGILRESEDNAARLFGSRRTIYSCEGSSLCIRAMIQLACLYAADQNVQPRILAARNAHKTFMYAAAFSDPEVEWIWGMPEEGLLSCTVDPDRLEQQLKETKATAVYITTPDYAGHMNDVSAIAEVCHRAGALLLVDNAHGAYLKFLPGCLHPMDAGADMCCDSAHKTLPVLTGGAYLHISRNAPAFLDEWAEAAFSLFASTSPSYHILQSLDQANTVLADDKYSKKLIRLTRLLDVLRGKLVAHGYIPEGNEPMKLTLRTEGLGITGDAAADHLREYNIECEYSDHSRIVLMPSPANTDKELDIVENALLSIPRGTALTTVEPPRPAAFRDRSIRSAMLAPRETLPISDCEGRILADACVSCPPAVPILIAGEVITEAAIHCFRYYGIEQLTICKK